MSKVRAYYEPDPLEAIHLAVLHYWWTDPYGPGAYHEIYPYDIWDMPPGYTCGQPVPTIEEGIIAAHTWASMPAMVNDLCVSCRYFGYGANTPRWNIYRGEERPKPSLEVPPYPRHFIPGFVQAWWDPYPPGFGPPP